jgi:arylformamidase
MLGWPGLQVPEQDWHLRMERGDPCNISNWKLGVHTGTHLDAPVHFLPDGADLETAVPIENLFGPALVLDVSERDEHVT